MNRSFGDLFEVIKQFETIIVLRHIHPDYDALGSQFGMIRWLQQLFPAKTILAGGNEPSLDDTFISDPDAISLEQCKGALAIAVDTSTIERIDGLELWNACSQHLCIDHHIRQNKMCELEYIDTTASSCSEIIAELIYELTPEALSQDVAEVLYAGIIADSMRFSIASTTAKTLEVASQLLSTGIAVNRINNQVFECDLSLYRFTIKLREKAVYFPEYAYAIINKSDFEQFGVSGEKAKSKVSIFGEIKGIKAWALFAENDDSSYSASLRSHDVALNDIAEHFGGGGHKCACGIATLSLEQCNEVIEMIKQRITE